MLEEELGEPHHVVADCKEYREQGSRQDPPLLLSLVEEETEKE